MKNLTKVDKKILKFLAEIKACDVAKGAKITYSHAIERLKLLESKGFLKSRRTKNICFIHWM